MSTSTSLRRFGFAAAGALLFALAAGSYAQQPGAAKPVVIQPVDDGVGDPTWLAFKARFIEAANKRDRTTLLQAIDPDVDSGPDSKRGIAEFRQRWDWDKDTSPLWRELSTAIGHGGAFLKGSKGLHRICAPYVAVRWPSDVDPFVNGAITTRDVLVKARASSQSDTIARMSHEVVRVEDWEVDDETSSVPQKWTKIRVGAQSGFVPEEHIRSPIEHLACFVKTGNQWRLVSFTAGDLPD